jgi:hypothetical protein
MNLELKAEIVRRYGAQYPFAAALGIRESTVSAVVRGHRALNDEEKSKWAAALGCNAKKIFQEEKTNGN